MGKPIRLILDPYGSPKPGKFCGMAFHSPPGELLLLEVLLAVGEGLALQWQGIVLVDLLFVPRVSQSRRDGQQQSRESALETHREKFFKGMQE